jgi:transcriptional regulator with XRE-family HTH domain
MINMDLLSVIRRWALRDELSIREIARRTSLSRNTIRKYLRSDVVEAPFKTPDRASKLDEFAGKLSGWLKTEASKPRKQKRTLKRLHADLVISAARACCSWKLIEKPAIDLRRAMQESAADVVAQRAT